MACAENGILPPPYGSYRNRWQEWKLTPIFVFKINKIAMQKEYCTLCGFVSGGRNLTIIFAGGNLAIQPDRDYLVQHSVGPLVEGFNRCSGNRMRNDSESIIRHTVGNRHGYAGAYKRFRTDDGCGNTHFFHDNAIEQTARAARASIADTGQNKITCVSQLTGGIV